MPFKEAGYLPIILGTYSSRMQNAIPIEQIGRQHQVHRQNIERFMDTSGKIKTNKFQLYNSLQAMDDQRFENVAETFEDYLWHKDTARLDYNTGNLTHNDLTEENLYGPIDTHRRSDQYPPFDIWILYGDIHTQAANHTIKKIINCTIIGESQVINVGGEPILEQYQFIATNRI